MIIGAGIGQVPLLRKAQARNIHTTVVSPDGEYPCLKIADAVFYRDIYDRDAIVDYALKNGITAVISDQNDLMMPTVAYVAESLHLPGNRLEQVLSYCNKSRFRENCRTFGIPVPRNCTVSTPVIPENMKEIPFPWIVKPEDSQSSIGITKVDKKEDLYPAIQLALSKSRNGRAVVEEFFTGHEIVCEGFIYHGKYHLLAFADRKYFHLDGKMIPCQTVFPSQLPPGILKRIVNYEMSMAERIDPSFAIVHSEYLVNLETEEIRCVESALRGGGVYISSHLIPAATGIDINDLLLDCVLGIEENVDTILSRNENKSSAYICFSLPDGIIENVQGIEELKSLPYIPLMQLENLVVGKECHKLTYKGDRHGPILVVANDLAQLNERIEHIKNTLHVLVRTSDGAPGEIFWE
jgi:biotin carboxylase